MSQRLKTHFLIPCLILISVVRGLSIKYVDFLCNSGLLYDNFMKSCIDMILFMVYFMVCNIRQCFNKKYSLFMFP